MAKKVMLVSDISGDEINPKDSAVVTITYSDARKGMVKLDVNAEEIEFLAIKGTKMARRGRKPKAQAD